MKTKRILALFLMLAMLIGMMPTSVLAYYEEPRAEGNDELEAVVKDYTKPVGVTMQRLTGNCVSEVENLGDDFLFVIKKDDRYYAMKDVAASESSYESIPAVDITDWVNGDGSLTVPAETLGVAFWRYEEHPDYEYGMFINGRNDFIAYTYGYESVDGDDDYYNDAERNYWGKFKVRTFEDGYYINDPYYWSENEISGTLKFNGSWTYYYNSYNSKSIRYEVITDLRSDGLGGQEFYFRYLGAGVEYTGEEVEGYLYYTDCRHQYTIRHAEYDAPTCMLKGCEEYWYCEGCDEYYADEAMTMLFGEEMPVIPATGHDWGIEECSNCKRPVPVYSKVTNQEQFDALADDTMFILVAEYDGKHYVMDLSGIYLYMNDSDGDGYYDVHDIDENGNDIPDYFEFDEGGEEGVYDYLEWDMDDDGDVDEEDIYEFHLMVCEQHLTDMLYNNGGVSATEITVNTDGTISHEEAKKTAEFEMVDVYLEAEIDSMIEDIKETESWWEDDMRYIYECVKQFVIPNYFISAPGMRPIDRMYQQRIYDMGDSSHWGVLFYNDASNYNYYSYGTESVRQPEFNSVCTADSVVVFSTYDYYWYDQERQMEQLRLRDYNDTITFVTGHDWELEGSEYVEDLETGVGYYDTHDTQACVYLYASAPYQAAHICDFGNWVDDGNGRTHTRTCKEHECDKNETESHNWNEGVQVGNPICTEGATIIYTCDDCGATKEEDVDNLVHDWGEWTYESVDSHIRYCKRNCGVEEQFEGHDWGEWTVYDNNTHRMTCLICHGYQEEEHDWDDGVVTTEPSYTEMGVKTYTCLTCSHTKNEEFLGIVDTDFSGMLVFNGQWIYVNDGKFDNTYTGMAENSAGWWYMKEGVLDRSYTGTVEHGGAIWYVKSGKFASTTTGMYIHNGQWIYVNKGKFDNTYTGMAENAAGLWYMKKGVLDRTYTGMCLYNGQWIYIDKGRFDKAYTGMAENSAGWWYMKEGILDRTYTGMVEHGKEIWYVKSGKFAPTITGMYIHNGKWIYVNKGKFESTYTGMAENTAGIWYMKEGVLDRSYTGMIVYNGQWIYINKGKFDKAYTGMAENSAGWWYMKNGILDRTYTGTVEQNDEIWYVKSGKFAPTITGMYIHNGKWIYVNKGKFESAYTGMAENTVGIWYMKDGVLDRTYTGMIVSDGKWIYVMNGKFNTAYTGIAENAYGKWYMKNGVLDRTFTGKIVINKITYTIVNGRVK